MIELLPDLRPLWILRVSGHVDGDDVRAVTKYVEEMHDDDKSLLIVDATYAERPAASVRTGLADLTGARSDIERTPAVAIIVSSPLLKTALTAILWAAPGQSHVKAVSTAEQALDHVAALAPDLVPAELRSRALAALERDAG